MAELFKDSNEDNRYSISLASLVTSNAADLINFTKRTYWKNTGASQNLQEAGGLARRCRTWQPNPAIHLLMVFGHNAAKSKCCMCVSATLAYNPKSKRRGWLAKQVFVSTSAYISPGTKRVQLQSKVFWNDHFRGNSPKAIWNALAQPQNSTCLLQTQKEKKKSKFPFSQKYVITQILYFLEE